LPSVIAIDAGGGFSLALDANGIVWAWGDNRYGQLGDGTFTSRAIAAPVTNLSSVVAISVHTGAWSMVLKADGTVWTFGRNQHGQLGQGTFTSADTGINLPGPVLAQGSVNPDGTLTPDAIVFDKVVAIGTGIAVRSDWSIWDWGSNTGGELGNNTITPNPPSGVPNPVQVLGSGGSGFLAAPVALGGTGFIRLSVDIASPCSWSGVLQPVN